MSAVHMHRMMRELRERRLVVLGGQRLEILDWDALAVLGDFDPTFLHLHAGEQPRRH